MNRKFFNRLINVFILVIFCTFLFGYCLIAIAGEQQMIFPLPQEMVVLENHFKLDEKTLILIPEEASENDLFLAHLLVAELSDKYGLALNIEYKSKVPSDKNVIIMGSVDNPLVKEYCTQQHLEVTAENPGFEGYVLNVNKNTVIIAGCDVRGAFYGLQSLRQLIKKDGELRIQCVHVRDWPNMPFRGVRLYIPGSENIPFFKRFLRDFMALYKFNKVIIEVNAGMRFDRHPELNAGWIEFAKNLNYTRRDRPTGPEEQSQDSAHHDAADGGVLEKQEVKDLVRFANQYYIEVIPEIPSLTHVYYLLTRHRELAEIQNAEWPDTYCPSNPKSYELLFDVLDEFIEVITPKMIHIGHDEWRMPIDVCPRCKGKDYSELFVQDVNKIYDYLTKKGIKVAMWGDHLLESVRGKGLRDRVSPTGYKYKMPGGLSPIQVKESIPKDILVFNWFWSDEKNDIAVEQFGFKQVYGNFKPNISNWDRRVNHVSVIGGAPSSWAATTEFNFGKDLIYDFLGCANLLWSRHLLEQNKLFKMVQSLVPEVRTNLNGRKFPSEDGDHVVPVNIVSYFNASSGKEMLGTDLSSLKTGRLSVREKIFELTDSSVKSGKCAVVVGTEGEKENFLTREVKGIQINEDVSSLIFLHACAKQSANEKAYRYIYNFEDTADLLGWYEVIYEDDFVETIPVRYGVNIIEWNSNPSDETKKWEGRTGEPQSIYCYGADAIECSTRMQDNPITFFAFEWVNKRFGKKVKEINLKGSKNFKGYRNKVIQNNAIILIALSVVKKREIPKTQQIK